MASGLTQLQFEKKLKATNVKGIRKDRFSEHGQKGIEYTALAKPGTSWKKLSLASDKRKQPRVHIGTYMLGSKRHFTFSTADCQKK